MQEPAPAAPQAPSPPNLGEQIRQSVQQQIEAARAQAAAQGGGTPTVVVRSNEFPADMIPPQAVDIAMMFFVTMFAIIVGFPIARAIGRRIDRKGQQPKIPADMSAQLSQISQTVDAMAIEIERISEGQRFTTRLLADQQARRGGLVPGSELPSN